MGISLGKMFISIFLYTIRFNSFKGNASETRLPSCCRFGQHGTNPTGLTFIGLRRTRRKAGSGVLLPEYSNAADLLLLPVKIP